MGAKDELYKENRRQAGGEVKGEAWSCRRRNKVDGGFILPAYRPVDVVDVCLGNQAILRAWSIVCSCHEIRKLVPDNMHGPTCGLRAKVGPCLLEGIVI